MTTIKTMPKITRLNDLERKGKLIKGKWKLSPRHELTYQASEGKEEFTFDTSLVAAEPEALVVSVTEKEEDGKIVTSIVKLTGTWRANDQNQIEFEVTRQSGKSDVLTFSGVWKLNNSQELIYTYQKKYLKKKTTVLETLTFKGHWDISERNRLTYLLEGSSNESFRFRGAFQTTSIMAKKGEIRYQLGAEVESKLVGKRLTARKSTIRRTQTITLFGKWKLSDRLELLFEMEYRDGRRHEIRFGAEFTLAEGFTVVAQLVNQKGDPFGVEVVLTKEFLKTDAQAFLRLKKTLAESAIEAGVTIPW